jgi:hypothetical protein
MPDDDWRSLLDEKRRQTADCLIAVLHTAGVHEPDALVRSDLLENLPQGATALLLRRVWAEAINPYRSSEWIDHDIAEPGARSPDLFSDESAALRRLIALGAAPADISAVARVAAYTACFSLLWILDGGPGDDIPDDAPVWALMEALEIEGKTQLTGRRLHCLYESLLTSKPSEARP